MNPALPSDTAALLRAHGLRPRKRWGQNFLCDQNVLDRIVKAAALQSGDHVLEIGPGLGALTRTLAAASAQVTAVEIDPLLEPLLKETLAGLDHVRLVFADFLKLDIPALLDEMGIAAVGPKRLPGTVSIEPRRDRAIASPLPPQITVVANIPYYITSPIIAKLFEHKERISRIVLTVQQEVADRLVALPGTEAYGSMSVFAQFHSTVEVIGKVSRHVFLPQPDVDSAIVRITPLVPGKVNVKDENRFFQIVHAAFGQRRKTIANALAGARIGMDRESAARLLGATGIDPVRRGETLSLDEFARLANVERQE
jgi:16S rRNA (adenine1518-N6/adenine1519-N6)-dimethyltransferase